MYILEFIHFLIYSVRIPYIIHIYLRFFGGAKKLICTVPTYTLLCITYNIPHEFGGKYALHRPIRDTAYKLYLI